MSNLECYILVFITVAASIGSVVILYKAFKRKTKITYRYSDDGYFRWVVKANEEDKAKGEE